MKRTCWRCRALEWPLAPHCCALHYPTHVETYYCLPPNENIAITECVPDAECPKPLTIPEYVRLRRAQNENET